MGISLAFLIGLQVSMVAGQSCGSFKLYDGDNEVTNAHCTLFKTKACANGPSTFPNNLSVGASVEKPRDFGRVRTFCRNFTIPKVNIRIFAPGAIFTWRPPPDLTSRKHTKGYFLKLVFVGSGVVVCRLIDLQQFDLTTSTDFHFSLEIFPFLGESTEISLTYLTSLPPPTDLKNGALVARTVFSIPPAKAYNSIPDSELYPSKWTTSIRVKCYGNDKIVEARFDFPTADSLAKFTSFCVKLFERGGAKPVYEAQINKAGFETGGVYNFTNVPTGTYTVHVQPIDSFRHDLKKCQCWYMIGYTVFCTTCSISATELFNFTRTGLSDHKASKTSAAEATGRIRIGNTKKTGIVATTVSVLVLVLLGLYTLLQFGLL